MIRSFKSHWLKRLKLAFLLSFLVNLSMLAQDVYSVSGTVTETESNGPAPGVSVIIKGTSTGTVTDFDGNYTIEVATGDILEFQYLGFATESVIVTGQSTIDVTLKIDSESLGEVVVVGYGTQKEKNLTTSVAKVSGDVIEDRAVARAEDALRGRVAGLRIRTTTSEVGGDPKITLRGPGSITGSSSPLIVVDGIALGTDPSLLGDIDSNNIKEISVLKDAAAVAIYGSRGANGVVLVSLKDGVAGETKFSYNSYFGLNYVTKNDNFNSSVAEERTRLLAYADQIDALDPDADYYDNITNRYNEALAELEALDFINELGGGEQNLQDLVFEGGTTTNHSFSVRGGTELTKFNATANYLENEGVAITDNYRRYNAGLRVDSKSKNKKFKYGVKIRGSHVDQTRLGSRFTDVLRQYYVPTYFTEDLLAYVNPDNTATGDLNERNEVGDFVYSRAFDGTFLRDPDDTSKLWIDDETGLPVTTLDGNEGSTLSLATTGNVGPLANLLARHRTRKRAFASASTYLQYKIAKGLNFKQTISGNYRNTTGFYREDVAGEETAASTEREEERNERYQYNIESLLTYKRGFGKHNINAVAGFEFNNWQYYNQLTATSGYTNDVTNNIALADLATSSTANATEKLVSYLGRIQYDYDDRYLFSVTARTDGSTRFGTDNRYGFFPAASIGWNVGNESFLMDSDLISQLKLRASYGISGSNDISNNIYESLYRSQETFSTVSYNESTAIKSTVLPNSSLGWESLIEFNPGLDVTFGNNILSLSADYYIRTSKDLILDAPVSSAYGAQTYLQNIGEVQNQGVELELNSTILSKPNFNWNASGQFTLNRNEVKDLGNSSQIISAITQNTRPTEFIATVGAPITSFYGWVVDREMDFTQVDNPFNRFNNDFAHVFVKDLNGDGIIDDEDRTELGSPYPDFEWGFNSDFNIYNVDVSFSLQGSHGAEVRVADLDQLLYASESAAGPAATVDEDTVNLTRHRRFTDAHIQDASFVAFRNITVGYTFPSELTRKLKLDRIRLYLSGENLLYLMSNDYQGFNPEAAGQTSNNANTPLTDGYQRGDGPIVRTITTGLNFDF